jgi:hypothetical protein
MEQIVGNIQFGNNRIGHAFSIIQEEYLDGKMWREECIRKDEEIERLQKLLKRKRRGKTCRK